MKSLATSIISLFSKTKGKSELLLQEVVEDEPKGLLVQFDLNWYSRSPIELLRRPDEVYAYGRGSQRLFVWALDPFHHQLKLPELEDRFYLGLIQLWTRSTEYPSYDRALELIYGSRSELGDLRSDSSIRVVSGAREVLDWIFTASNNDHDPRAISLRLGAGLLIVENDFAVHRYSEIVVNNKKVVSSEFFLNNLEEFEKL